MTTNQDLTKAKELSETLHQWLQKLSRKPERTKQNIEDDIEVGYHYSDSIFKMVLEQFQELHEEIMRLDK